MGKKAGINSTVDWDGYPVKKGRVSKAIHKVGDMIEVIDLFRWAGRARRSDFVIVTPHGKKGIVMLVSATDDATAGPGDAEEILAAHADAYPNLVDEMKRIGEW